MDASNSGMTPSSGNSGGLGIRSSPNIKVRTMDSDIQTIAKTGGGVSGSAGMAQISKQAPAPPSQMRIPSPAPQNAGRDFLIKFLGSRTVLVLGFLGTLMALGLLGYFIVYPSVFQPSSPAPRVRPPSPITTNPPPKDLFTHESFFRLPADATFRFIFSSGPISSAADLQTFGQKITGLINESGQQGSLFEIQMEDDDGESLALADFLSQIHAEILGRGFLEENFNRDFTAFVYREKNNLWPGYVIRLKPGLTQLVLQDEVKKIESSPDIENLFLTEPLEPRVAEFGEKQVGTRPMRYLAFGNSGAVFAYAWFNSETLILSTSEEGLRRAFDYLGR